MAGRTRLGSTGSAVRKRIRLSARSSLSRVRASPREICAIAILSPRRPPDVPRALQSDPRSGAEFLVPSTIGDCVVHSLSHIETTSVNVDEYRRA